MRARANDPGRAMDYLFATINSLDMNIVHAHPRAQADAPSCGHHPHLHARVHTCTHKQTRALALSTHVLGGRQDHSPQQRNPLRPASARVARRHRTGSHQPTTLPFSCGSGRRDVLSSMRLPPVWGTLLNPLKWFLFSLSMSTDLHALEHLKLHV